MKPCLSIVAAVLVAAACAQKSSVQLLDPCAFETEVDGRQTALYTISNGDIILQATNYGGRVASLFVPASDGTFHDVVLGHEDIDSYVHYKKERFLGACVGPVANRICNATFTVDGVTYNLEKSHGGVGTLHGGFKGLDSVVWDVAEKTDTSVTFHYLHADGEGGFPGNLSIFMTYAVTPDRCWTISYRATTDKTTPVNISNHPYFNFTGGDSTVEDYTMYINASAITGIGDFEVLDPPIDISGTPMDYRTPHQIRSALESDYDQIVIGKGFDHNYCITLSDSTLTLDAVVCDPVSGISMEVLSDQPGLQVYSAQYFTGEEPGKYGTTLNYHGSITFETQNWPDAPNKPSFPDPYLKPGQEYSHTCVYRFSNR